MLVHRQLKVGFMTDRKVSVAGGQKYDRKVTNVNEKKIFFNRIYTAFQPIEDYVNHMFRPIYALFNKAFVKPD